MTIEIIIFGILCYFVWKRKEKIEANNYSVRIRTLFYLPFVQFLLCSLFCSLSFVLDGNMLSDEINMFADEHEFMNNLSILFLGIDFTTDQAGIFLLIEKLQSQARYILTSSFVIYAIQIYSAFKRQFNRVVIESFTIFHTLLIFYIGNLWGETIVFIMNQTGTMKILNAISNSAYSGMYGLLVIWLLPFHYLYHFIIKKYYSMSE